MSTQPKRISARLSSVSPDFWRGLANAFDVATLVSAAGPAVSAFLGVPLPELASVLTAVFAGLALYARWASPKELFPVKRGEPFVFLGKDELGLPIRIGVEGLKRHLLVLGTTGSGKTVTLRALSLLPVWLGGGLTFVDGKADVADTYEPFYALACAADRAEDFLVLNFLDPTQSNTWNPLMDRGADTDYCVEVLGGLLPPATGDQTYWRGRGMALMRGVMACLVWMRDNQGRLFDIWDVKEHLAFGKALELLELVINGRIPMRDRRTGRPIGELLLSYFNELGPWHEALAEMRALRAGRKIARRGGGRGPREQLEVQHNYAAQQWTDVLGLLGGTFAPIFATKNPDIEMSDVITNSRILYVLLPSLGKSRDTLEAMGRMVLTAIRMALFQLLGKRIVGKVEEVKGAVRAFRPAFPHLGIFDEFGSYMVSGFSDVVAQARSLGYSAVFAGQEIGRFLRKDEGEAKALFANTGIKIVMRTVDTDTSKFVVELAGETWYLVPASIREEVGIIDRVRAGEERRLEKRPAIETIDLARFEPGEAYFFGKGEVRRGRVFYVKPEKTPKHFVIFKPRPLDEVREAQGAPGKSYARRLLGELVRAKSRYAAMSAEEVHEALRVITPACAKFLALSPTEAVKDPAFKEFLRRVARAGNEIEEELREADRSTLAFRRLIARPPRKLVEWLVSRPRA